MDWKIDSLSSSTEDGKERIDSVTIKNADGRKADLISVLCLYNYFKNITRNEIKALKNIKPNTKEEVKALGRLEMIAELKHLMYKKLVE